MPNDRTPQEILNGLCIASPCEVPWSAMNGDDRVRHCAQCDRKVYNVARLSAEEAVALLRTGDRPPCFQLWRRADGTVITADCPVGVRRLRNRRRATLALALTTLLAACGRPSAEGSAPTSIQPAVLGGLVQMDPHDMPSSGGDPVLTDVRLKPKPPRHTLKGKVVGTPPTCQVGDLEPQLPDLLIEEK